jgi:hypothetical protein
MERVTEEILAHGEYLGVVRGHERWGLGRDHVIPRTGPSNR